jgi:protein-tyrosine phosphatase
MERSSEFIENKALFGSYPLQEQVYLFESIGVRYFVDLTCEGEKKITQYKTNYTYIRYSIPDRRVPTNWISFSKFIIKIGSIIKSLGVKEKIYIHCKGGHGRSGVVVASLLCYLYNMEPPEALRETKKYHSLREEMRLKWRKLGSPQTRSQKHFVTKFFEPLYIYNNYSKYFSSGFNNDANITVMVPSFGLFPTATSAFCAFKDPDNTEYVKNLELLTDVDEIRKIDKEYPNNKDWYGIRENIMCYVLQLKFDQHKVIRNNLLNTGLRPIIFRSVDSFWGMLDISGKNRFGNMLCDIRNNMYNSGTIFT